MSIPSHRDPSNGDAHEQQGSPLGAPFVLTQFPPREAVVTPSDTTDFDMPAMVQAIEAGSVSYIPAGNESAAPLSRTLEAGEWIPVLVRRVMATSTDDIELRMVW